MSGLPTVVVLVVVAVLNVCAVVFVPKGPQQTALRTSIVLTLLGCYLLWMITYLAQTHPLVAPRRAPPAQGH